MKKFLKLLDRLKRSWVSSTLYFQTSEGVGSEKRSGQFFDAWIVSRELCIFETLDLSMVPPGKRDFSLRQQIDAISPFKSFGHWVQWSEGHAAVWIWDRELQESLAERFIPGRSIGVYPETNSLIPEQGGCFGYRSSEGYFMQLWDGQKLIAETSWLDEPTDDEQSTFFETYGINEAYPIREWSRLPVSPYPDSIQSIKKIFLEKSIFPALFVCFIAAFVFQSVAFMRLNLSLSQIEDKTQRIEEEKFEIVGFRSSAREKQSRLQKLSMLAKPTQIELMGLLAVVLGEESNSLIEWVYESGRVEALFASPRSSPEVIVERLEKTAYFSSISLEIDAVKGRVRIIMDMVSDGS